MSRNPTCTIYVGNLPGDVREEEIDDLFHKYGRIVDIELKLPPRPPGFCFVEFADPRDAEDAIEARNGYKYEGNYLRVELAHGGRGPPPSSDRHSSYSNSHNSGRSAPRKAEFRVLVTKLPPTASWQDLKDHMRKAGDVSFAQVFREGGGIRCWQKLLSFRHCYPWWIPCSLNPISNVCSGIATHGGSHVA